MWLMSAHITVVVYSYLVCRVVAHFCGLVGLLLKNAHFFNQVTTNELADKEIGIVLSHGGFGLMCFNPSVFISILILVTKTNNSKAFLWIQFELFTLQIENGSLLGLGWLWLHLLWTRVKYLHRLLHMVNLIPLYLFY